MTSDTIQHPFIIKLLRKLEIEEKLLNITKNIYENPISDIVLNSESLNQSIRKEKKKRNPKFYIIFNYISIKLGEKAIQTEKEEVKLYI